jgi:serine/threonine protein kinase
MKLCPKCQKQFSDDANFCPVDAARLLSLEGQTVAADSISSRFEVGARLGGGRTGAVHRAADKTTGQIAALKIIAPEVVALPGLAPRLERELKQLERVQSAGVAKVLASGKRGDDSWVALEMLDGAQTLAEAIAARGPIPIELAAHLIEVVGEALIEAAQVGVVHRDLAPKNVLFSGDDVKLINFSLPVPPVAAADRVPGVAAFVAPEQHDGKPVDQRSNLYSLGALYYFVLTGLVVQLDDAGAVKPPSLLAQVPAAVEAIILRALDRSPTKRFLTVRQFVDEVGRVARGEVDPKAALPLGRPGKPKAELVQTLLGIRGAGGNIVPHLPGAAGPGGPVAGSVAPGGPMPGVVSGAPEMPAPLPPQALTPDRSPWAPPATVGPSALGMAQAMPILTDAVVPTQSDTIPDVIAAGSAAPAAPAPVVAAPVVPPPLLAPPILGTSAKKSSKSDGDSKGKFRETLWFKKGELDAEAAAAAAEERARTGRASSTDKADSLPLDERYKDDGSVSRSDKEKYSLRTGGTVMTKALRDPGAGDGKVTEDALIDEMKGGRTLVFAGIAVGVLVIALIIFLLAR